MKYVVILGDGMADYSKDFENGLTPLKIAKTPNIDRLVPHSEIGLLKTVPCGMKPGSDVANLSVLGYNVKECYTGRSPLEAASIGISLKETDVTARANLVTLSEEDNYAEKTMIDYSAGEISTNEAQELISALAKEINSSERKIYAGISYRHCLVTKNGSLAGDLTPPHDITGRKIKDYLPNSKEGKSYLALMEKSYEILKNHPVNLKRKEQGKRPANSLWFWGEGTKPNLDSFYNKFGLNGAIISAVDLLKGIAKLTGMQSINVKGATGNYDTDFSAKAEACLNALREGKDFVYVHIEAPDECGHHGDKEHKIYSIEQIDEKVIGPIVDSLKKEGEEFSILVLPDHPTPLSIMTHCVDPVPYLLYRSNKTFSGVKAKEYTEDQALLTGIFFSSGEELMKKFVQK